MAAAADRFVHSGIIQGLRFWAVNSAVECHLHTVEVTGSIPVSPTIFKTIFTQLNQLGKH
jgi:hypothetical protein